MTLPWTKWKRLLAVAQRGRLADQQELADQRVLVANLEASMDNQEARMAGRQREQIDAMFEALVGIACGEPEDPQQHAVDAIGVVYGLDSDRSELEFQRFNRVLHQKWDSRAPYRKVSQL